MIRKCRNCGGGNVVRVGKLSSDNPVRSVMPDDATACRDCGALHTAKGKLSPASVKEDHLSHLQKTVEKSTHGPQHDEFGTRTSDAHGGATFDEGFNSFAAAHSTAHGKLFDKFSERPGVDRYGERWDEFPWKDMPSLHGQHYDEGYDSPSFEGGEHGRLHDVFRGARVRYMYGGRDVEGVVLDTQKEFAVVESREGDRHEVPLPQVLAYASDSGAPSRPEGRTAEPATVDTSVVSQKPSAPANGGKRVEGGSYDDSVVTHVKSLDDALEVVKSLVPFDEAEFDRDAYAFADVAKSSDGNPGVAHLSTAKLTEAHSKFSDHYTAARVTGNHERAHFAATVLASVHHELATRGVMADAPDEGATPVTRGLSKGHQPLRNKSAADDTDVAKVDDPSSLSCSGCGKSFKGSLKTFTHSQGGESGRKKQAYQGTCPGCGTTNQSAYIKKSMDADETATQSQDLASEGANWCKTCQHYCRDARGGKCPTCGHPVGVKKNWADALDVLKETANAS